MTKFQNKSQYDVDEPVTIYAELEYIGDKNTVEIFHAASPFYFPIYEKSRDIHIQYNMNEPLVSTTLTKGEPLQQTYQGSGSYGSSDSKEYAEFMKSIMNNQFLIGSYEVNGFADFFIQETDSTKKDYELKAKVDFEVQDMNK